MAAGARARSLLRQAEALVGLPYVDGEFDCGHLAVLAAQHLFGRTVQLPGANPHPVDPRAQGAVLAHARREIARRVDEPSLGAVVLFTEAAEAGGTQWHIGTVVALAPEVWVLHTRAGSSSLLQRLADCTRQGLMFEGWYEWR